METPGVAELTCTGSDNTEVRVRITFDPATDALTGMTVINGGKGSRQATMTDANGVVTTVTVLPGTRSYTPAQLAAMGFVNHADIAGTSLAC